MSLTALLSPLALPFLNTSLSTELSRLLTSLTTLSTRLRAPDLIRLVAIVGAYLLLRPYLVSLGARFQAKDHERELDPAEMRAAVVANGVRGVRGAGGGGSESEDEAKGGEWGKKARKRQRRVVRGLVEAEEKRRREEEEAESDKELEEFLWDEDEAFLAKYAMGPKEALDESRWGAVGL